MATATIAADEPLPGVVVSISGPKDKAEHESRISRLIALYVPAGSAPASHVRPGPFSAEFTGNLNLRLRSYVKFHAEGRGKVILLLNGATVLESSGDDLSKVVSDEVRLNKGKNVLLARYQSPDAGDAALRLFWESKSFPPEPVPAALLTHEPPGDDVATSIRMLEGQSLVGEFRCLRCHANTNTIPELSPDAPDLTDIGSRLKADWLAAWIEDPQKLRPGAHMPQPLHGIASKKIAADLAAYLASQGKPAPAPKVAGDAANGGRLFANLECVVCHTPPAGDDDPSRIALKYVAAKFQPAALQQYLLDPASHYAWNPMPRFALSETEAADIAVYLAADGQSVPKSIGGDAALGEGLLVSSGCMNCHAGKVKPAAQRAFPFMKLGQSERSSGCMSEEPDAKSPHFTFQASQRQAILAALNSGLEDVQRCDAELAEAEIREMRCTACHARDASESLLSQSLADASQSLHQQFPNPPVREGELIAAEQRIPSLTFAGDKLRPEWMRRFIGGKLDYKPRYFLRARMPAFAARAATLATGIAEQHGLFPSLPELPKPNAAFVEAGRALCGKTANVGFSCNQCHPIAGVAPFAPFEAPSINFQYVAERMQPDYYSRWMHDPARIDPATKMPRFADFDDKTGLAAFDHDATRQFDAIWQYLLTGRKIEPPQ